MKVKLSDIHEVISKIPTEEKKKWGRLSFVIDNEALVLQDGNYVKADWSNGGIITIYAELIKDKDDLKKTILHELAHHLGLDHKVISELGL